MSIPTLAKVQTDNREVNQLQSNIATVLNPLITNPLSGGRFLFSVVLVSGVTIIPHGLGTTPQGWFLTDINAAATVYRSSPFNPQTLVLTSSAVATVSFYVF